MCRNQMQAAHFKEVGIAILALWTGNDLANERPIAARAQTTDLSKGQGLCHRREYPVKWQNSEQPGLRRFPMPPAVGIRTGKILVSKYSHRLIFRERHVIAFSLEVNIVTAVGALENNSIS
jgi:hypothetical protein